MDLEELLENAEQVYDGWYAERRIEWHDFLARLEDKTGHDLGASMSSPEIVAIQKHIRMYRRL